MYRVTNKYYVEYEKDGKTSWCIMEAYRTEDIEYTVNLYDGKVIKIEKINAE